MSLTKYTGAINTIQSLTDRPNQTEGLTAAAVKAKFDKAAIDMKAYVDNTLTVEIDNLDSANVKKTGDQTIDGVKTFESSPIVPAPTTDMQASTKKYVDDMGISKTNDLNEHKTSADHDGRYYTETETDNLLSGKVTQGADFTGTWQGYTPTMADPGIASVVVEHTSQLADNTTQITALQTNKADKTEVNSLATGKANQTDLDATNTQLASIASGSPAGVFATLAALQADATANTTDGKKRTYVITGNVAEVASLTITAIPTTAGNVTVTLNGVAANIAVDPATDTTTSAVATKIRNSSFSGWTTGGTGAVITFTCNTTGVKTDSVYSAGSTGAAGTMTTTTQGVDADGKWYYWNGTAWTAAYSYQSPGISDYSVKTKMTDFIKTIDNLLNPANFISGGYYAASYGAGADYTATWTTAADYSSSPFIEVEINKTYRISRSWLSIGHLVFWTKDKKVVSGIVSPTIVDSKYCDVVIPNNQAIKYITFMCMTVYVATMVLTPPEIYYSLNKNIKTLNVIGLDDKLNTIGQQWKEKNWVAFGTSITATASGTGKYVPYLVSLSGMKITNYGIAGGSIGFVDGVLSGNILTQIKSVDLSTADLITLEGFINDFAGNLPLGQIGDTTNTTLAGALYDAITYMQTNSHATIVCFTEHTGKATEQTYYTVGRLNDLGLKQYQYNDMIATMCNYLGVPVIRAGEKSMINQWNPQYLIDHIHHTELGGKQYANTIWDELKNIHVKVIA